MAHFARVDKTTKEVLHVHCVDNKDCIDAKTKQESEFTGEAYLKKVHAQQPWINDIVFVQTSYTHSKRGRYAGKGMKYNLDKDEFEHKTIEEKEIQSESLVRKASNILFSSSISVPKIRFGECNKPGFIQFIARNNFRRIIFMLLFVLVAFLFERALEQQVWATVCIIVLVAIAGRFILKERQVHKRL